MDYKTYVLSNRTICYDKKNTEWLLPKATGVNLSFQYDVQKTKQVKTDC